MSYAIFYDLETSEQASIGQILNYCFILVGPNRDVLSECSGLVRIRCLELPSPGAILANRIDVQEHQRVARDSELIAMGKIYEFIANAIQLAGQAVVMIGFNSSRFDLNFLRTSFIRNGFNPYFGGKVRHRDLLHAAQYLSLSHAEFPRLPQREGDPAKLSLRLENLGRVFGLLEGNQRHESREDVLLTIAVSNLFRERFDVDPVEFDAYPRLSRQDKGGVWEVLKPQYDLTNTERLLRSPQLLLDCDHRSSLWVDLQRFGAGEGRASVQWCSVNRHALFLGRRLSDVQTEEQAQCAKTELSGVNLANFFARSTCDIEADIYRLGFGAIDLLTRAIHQRQKGTIFEHPSEDLHTIFRRFLVVNHQAQGAQAERVRELFRDYVELRYRGKLQLSRERPLASTIDAKDGAGREQKRAYSTSFQELMAELEQLRAVASRPGDEALLNSLQSFYRESDVCWVLEGKV